MNADIDELMTIADIDTALNISNVFLAVVVLASIQYSPFFNRMIVLECGILMI
jgi:hypothetical protein